MEVQRNILAVGREMLNTFPAVVIQGARQVGKSTLAEQLVKNEMASSVTLDSRVTRESAVNDELAFVDQFPEGTLIVDEVQRVPGLLLAIKESIDNDRRPGRFLLTGSANLLHVKGETDSLAGRAVTLRLRGFSQGELEGRQEDFVSVLQNKARPERFASRWNRATYVEALAKGSYPEVRHLNGRMRNAWLDSYLERVLERDAVMLPSGGQTQRLRSVLNLVAANQAGELVKSRIADQSEIPKNTITTYIDVLSSVFLVDQIRPWSANLTKREIGRPKMFVADSALAMRLNRISPSQLLPITASSIGGLFEAFVASELLKQQSWTEQPFELFHFRDRNGLEVDLVAELDDGRVVGFEIKSSSTYRSEHFAGLRFLRDKLGDRFVAGFVLGMSESSHKFSDRLYGLPASALWEWVG